jgi:hypothetical protein
LVLQGPIDSLRSGAAAGETLETMFLRVVGATDVTPSHLDWLRA